MKSYTDLEQSQKLAEILPAESADMYYTATTYGERHEIIGTSWELHLGLDAATKDHLFSLRTIGSIELTYVHQFQQFLRLCGMNELANNFKI